MRFKVRLQNDDGLEEALHLLESRVSVYLTSTKRRFIATGELPDDIKEKLIHLGAQISVDERYDLD